MADQLPLWDGRYANAYPGLNDAPLPEIRRALHEARSRIDHAIASLNVITGTGPGFVGAAKEVSDALDGIATAQKLIKAEVPGQIRRWGELRRAPAHAEAPHG